MTHFLLLHSRAMHACIQLPPEKGIYPPREVLLLVLDCWCWWAGKVSPVHCLSARAISDLSQKQACPGLSEDWPPITTKGITLPTRPYLTAMDPDPSHLCYSSAKTSSHYHRYTSIHPSSKPKDSAPKNSGREFSLAKQKELNFHPYIQEDREEDWYCANYLPTYLPMEGRTFLFLPSPRGIRYQCD